MFKENTLSSHEEFKKILNGYRSQFLPSQGLMTPVFDAPEANFVAPTKGVETSAPMSFVAQMAPSVPEIKGETLKVSAPKIRGRFSELLNHAVDAFSELVDQKADMLEAYQHLQEKAGASKKGVLEQRAGEILEQINDNVLQDVYGYLFESQSVKIVLQEKKQLKSNDTCEYEALVRPPKFGTLTSPFEEGSMHTACLKALLAIGPEGFCRTAQNRGLGFELDSYIFEQTALAKGGYKGKQSVNININILPSTFCDPHFAPTVEAYCSQLGLNPREFGFEILESERVQSMEDLRTGCEALKKVGCKISIDDFCTGFAHPSYLYFLPADEIKIPRDFLELMDERQYEGRAKCWMKSIVNQAHKNGLKVVVEGVETQEQAQFVKAIGADSAQGYFYKKPVGIQDVLEQLTKMQEPERLQCAFEDSDVKERLTNFWRNKRRYEIEKQNSLDEVDRALRQEVITAPKKIKMC